MKSYSRTQERKLEWISDRLYALNKRVKGEGIAEKDERGIYRATRGNGVWERIDKEDIGKYSTNDLTTQEIANLYYIKNKIIIKYGKPTGEFHRFPGGKVGSVYKVGTNTFHRFGYGYDLIDQMNKEAGFEKFSYRDVDNSKRIGRIPNELRSGVKPFSRNDYKKLLKLTKDKQQ